MYDIIIQQCNDINVGYLSEHMALSIHRYHFSKCLQIFNNIHKAVSLNRYLYVHGDSLNYSIKHIRNGYVYLNYNGNVIANINF